MSTESTPSMGGSLGPPSMGSQVAATPALGAVTPPDLLGQTQTAGAPGKGNPCPGETARSRACERKGGTWNSSTCSCEMPPRNPPSSANACSAEQLEKGCVEVASDAGNHCDCSDVGNQGGGSGKGGGGGGSSGINTTVKAPQVGTKWIDMSDREFGILDFIENLGYRLSGYADSLFNMGYTDLAQASEFFEVLMGKGGRYAAQSALAPTIENLRATTEGAGLGEGYLARSGFGTSMGAALKQGEAADVARLYSGVQPQAAQALAGIGSGALGLGGQFYSAGASMLGGTQQVLGAERHAKSSFNFQRDYVNADFRLKARLGELGADVSIYGIDKQYEAAMASVGLGYARLAADMEKWDKQFQASQKQAKYSQSWAEYQFAANQQAQSSQAKGAMFGQFMGIAAASAPYWGPALFSTIKAKEGLAAPTPAEEALDHIVEASKTLQAYRYTGDAEVIPNGIIIEMAPRYGFHGDKLNVPTAIGDLMAAVSILSEQNEKLQARIAQLEKEGSDG